MNKTTILGLGLAALLLVLPKAATAQVSVSGGISLGIAFPEPPPLVVVRPGIQIVPEYDQEVFFTGGYYWARHGDGWYRCHDFHGGDWRPVRYDYVPTGLRRIPPGRFAHYYRDDDGHWRSHRDDEWHDWRAQHAEGERRDWWHAHQRDRAIRAEQDRAWHDRQREDREVERAESQRQAQMHHGHDRAH